MSRERLQPGSNGVTAQPINAGAELGYWRGLWRRCTQGTTNRRIFGAALVVGLLTLVARSGHVARDLVLAAWFGTGHVVDAFLIALLTPLLLVNIVAASFNIAFIPAFIRRREREGPAAAQQLFSRAMGWIVSLLFGVTLLLALTAPYVVFWLASGFSPEKLALTRTLFYWLLPIILVNGLATIWGAVLNSDERFALPALSPILIPLAAIGALMVYRRDGGILALAVGTMAGHTLEAAVLGMALHQRGIRLWPLWGAMNSDLRRLSAQYWPMVGGALLMNSASFASQAMAAMLAPGSVAALGYGNKVTTLILTLGATAIATPILPYFSQQVSRRDWSALRHTFHFYSRLIFAVATPVVLILILFSEPLVRLIFQRGAFSAADTARVARIQSLYLLQTPFYIIVMMGTRLLSSLAKNHVLMAIFAINLLITVLGNYVLMTWMGVSGIALATSVAFFVLSSLMYWAIKRSLYE